MHHQVSVAYEGIDTDTPQNVKLNAKYTKSFAYYTVKDRLPVILTKVINELATRKGEILQQYGSAAEEDLKFVIGKISKLKNEVVTNKSFLNLCSKGEDVEDWNKYLDSQTDSEPEPPCWYYSPWLYAECYMYRRLWEIFENRLVKHPLRHEYSASTLSQEHLCLENQEEKINFTPPNEYLQNYDPFLHQKEDAFEVSLPNIKVVGKITIHTLSEIESSSVDVKQTFTEFLKLSLWSNRCDLSLSNGAQLSEEKFNLHNINDLDSFLLCDDSERVYNFLKDHKNGTVDFVNDNSSYEVFSDFCFCDILCTYSLSSKIKFHVKKIPWYVSDVMKKDISWLLDRLEKEGLEKLSRRWRKYFQDGTWSLSDEKYWTLPFDYSDMRKRDQALYDSLKTADLVIFKGDLNYRKLLGDINWDHFEKFDVAVREFKPTNILSLRTVKADLICGLTPEMYKQFKEDDKMWMRTGDYGIIQFYSHT